jgi:hypothetical protein
MILCYKLSVESYMLKLCVYAMIDVSKIVAGILKLLTTYIAVLSFRSIFQKIYVLRN